MKKHLQYFALLLLLFVFSGKATAQFVYVGGGVNGYFINNPGEDAGSFMRSGYQLGADLMLGGTIYFRPGLHFVGTETNMTVTTDDGATISGSLNLSHLRIPLLGGIRFLNRDNLSVFAQTGPSGMTLLHVSESDIQKAMENDVRRLQWGWAFGGGVRIKFLELSVSYDTGLSSALGNEDSKNSRYGLLQFSLGFVF